MKFTETLLRGRLVRRYKRFLADIELESKEVITAHCANSGSMLGCDSPGSEVVLSVSTNPKRKLAHTWELVRVGSAWVGINTMRPNAIVEEGIRSGAVPELAAYRSLRREVPYGDSSRIDLLLEDGGNPDRCYVEVKNGTLAEGDLALFPDAVTTRGAKHLAELASDCNAMALAEIIDPDYAAAFDTAVAAGVEVMAYRTAIEATGIELETAVPVNP